VKPVDKFLITEEYPGKPEVKDNELVKSRKIPLQSFWTPVSTGVTTFYEGIFFEE